MLLLYKNGTGVENMTITLHEIGIVINEINHTKDTHWGGYQSTIKIHAEYREGLKGLDEFSHINVIYYLDKASFHSERDLIRRPKGREDMPKVGIFSQRAKNRPNTLGITSVKLLKVQHDTIYVDGLDAINGTPVLDIKPYYPQYDCKLDAKVPEWVQRMMEDYF